MPIEDLTEVVRKLDANTEAVKRLDANTDRVVRSQRVRTTVLTVFGFLFILAFVSGFIVANSRITANTDDIRRQLLVDCQLAKDIGESPIPPATGPLGRKIISDFRDVYNGKCIETYGPLKTVTSPPSPSPSSSRSPG